jgi:hypothetical protein
MSLSGGQPISLRCKQIAGPLIKVSHKKSQKGPLERVTGYGWEAGGRERHYITGTGAQETQVV